MTGREGVIALIAALAGYYSRRLAADADWSPAGQRLTAVLSAMFAALLVAANQGLPTQLAGLIGVAVGLGVAGWSAWANTKDSP